MNNVEYLNSVHGFRRPSDSKGSFGREARRGQPEAPRSWPLCLGPSQKSVDMARRSATHTAPSLKCPKIYNLSIRPLPQLLKSLARLGDVGRITIAHNRYPYTVSNFAVTGKLQLRDNSGGGRAQLYQRCFGSWRKGSSLALVGGQLGV